MTKRWMALALAGLLAFALISDAAVGIYQRAACTSLASPETGKTYCFEETTNLLKRWSGTAWETVPTSILTGTVTGTYTLGGTPTLGATLAMSGAPNLGTSVVRAGTGFFTALDTSGDATIGDQLLVSGAGPHAIGGATNADVRLDLIGAFTAGVGAVQGVRLSGTLTALANQDAFGLNVAPTLVEAGAGTHADFASVHLAPPTITAGAATLTNASTLKITGTPSGATNNFALWVAGGVSRFDSSDDTAAIIIRNIQSGTDQFRFITGTESRLEYRNATPLVFRNDVTERMRLTGGGILALGTTVTTGAGAGDLVSTKGWTTEAANAAHGNPAANAVTLYIREDIDVGAGTATADCAIRARKSDGTEVNIVTLVTDGGCP